jgi:hypothetical protein
LLVALDYLELLADVKPEKLEPAAVRWHGRLEVEAAAMTVAKTALSPAPDVSWVGVGGRALGRALRPPPAA